MCMRQLRVLPRSVITRQGLHIFSVPHVWEQYPIGDVAPPLIPLQILVSTTHAWSSACCKLNGSLLDSLMHNFPPVSLPSVYLTTVHMTRSQPYPSIFARCKWSKAWGVGSESEANQCVFFIGPSRPLHSHEKLPKVADSFKNAHSCSAVHIWPTLTPDTVPMGWRMLHIDSGTPS